MDFGRRVTEPEERGSHLIRRRFHGEDAFLLVNAALANNLLAQGRSCAVMEGIDVMLVADMHQRVAAIAQLDVRRSASRRDRWDSDLRRGNVDGDSSMSTSSWRR